MKAGMDEELNQSSKCTDRDINAFVHLDLDDRNGDLIRVFILHHCRAAFWREKIQKLEESSESERETLPFAVVLFFYDQSRSSDCIFDFGPCYGTLGVYLGITDLSDIPLLVFLISVEEINFK